MRHLPDINHEEKCWFERGMKSLFELVARTTGISGIHLSHYSARQEATESGGLVPRRVHSVSVISLGLKRA